MKEELVAPGVWRLAPMPPDVVNVYVVGDVLIDAGGRFGARRLVAALRGRTITAHALTHAHFDHQGASHEVCESLGVPLWCGRGDRDAMETGNLASILPDPNARIARLTRRLGGPAHPVARVLENGDQCADFTVIETPGHTPGHLAFWRERDRVLILGDVAFNRSPISLKRGLREPFVFATWDRAANRRSARKLAALRPEIVCFGHGRPLTNGEQFREYVTSLNDRTAG